MPINLTKPINWMPSSALGAVTLAAMLGLFPVGPAQAQIRTGSLCDGQDPVAKG